MASGDSTVWTVIRRASAGDAEARDVFARTYLPVVRAYLGARWAGKPILSEADDATQEVFVDFLKQGGALERLDPTRPRGFRAFLHGVVRTVALRIETRRARLHEKGVWHPPDLDAFPADDEALSRVFDRAWARAVVQEAGRRHEQAAHAQGDGAVRRREILRLRFQEGLPIREIAARWGADPARLHHDYARARDEFLEALEAVVAEHNSGTPAEIRRECERLLGLLA